MKSNELLKKYRLLNGMSQGQLAKKLGYISPQFVSNWERNKCNPPIKSLKKLCLFLHIPATAMKKSMMDDYASQVDKYL